jgi:PleD family two-component response regulator
MLRAVVPHSGFYLGSWKTAISAPASESQCLNGGDATLSGLTLSGGPTPMPKSVLVVDDNAVIRHVLCQVLASESDLDVCGEAENGRDAIEKAEELHPDLIVMDLSMPVMNGIDGARVLKKVMPTVFH